MKSGRSALVHKYVTGSYVAVEKPEGEELQAADLLDRWWWWWCPGELPGEVHLLSGSSCGFWSPPGGRFKKEVLVDGQSQLLLIREEAGPPDAQVRQREIEGERDRES